MFGRMLKDLQFSLDRFDFFLCTGTISACYNSFGNFEERIEALISRA